MLARKYQSQHENRRKEEGSSSSLSHLEPLDDGGGCVCDICEENSGKETSLSQIEENYQASPHPKSLLEDEDSPLRTEIKTRIYHYYFIIILLFYTFIAVRKIDFE